MTMSFIWIGMILISIFASALSGTTSQLSVAAMDGAKSAITLSLSLAGTLCLWSGLIRVMEVAGLNEKMARLFSPILRRLYPETSKDVRAMGYISGNVSANLLGLGNAATPLGISAVKRMKELHPTDTANDEMCRLIIMNTASIQLIPSTTAAARAACGSMSPFDILPAVWVTSICSVTVGLIAAKLLSRIWRD